MHCQSHARYRTLYTSFLISSKQTAKFEVIACLRSLNGFRALYECTLQLLGRPTTFLLMREIRHTIPLLEVFHWLAVRVSCKTSHMIASLKMSLAHVFCKIQTLFIYLSIYISTYIAPLQGNYSEALPAQARPKRRVNLTSHLQYMRTSCVLVVLKGVCCTTSKSNI